MQVTTKDRVAVNLAMLPKRVSFYAYTLGGALLSAFLAASDAQKQAVYEALHVPPAAYPLIALGIGLISQVWPQKATAPEAVQAKLDEKVEARVEKAVQAGEIPPGADK